MNRFFMNGILLCMVLAACSVSATVTVIEDDFRIDLDEDHLTAVGTQPEVICDSLGNYTVIWDERGELMGRAFDRDGVPVTGVILLSGKNTEILYAAENGAFATLLAEYYQVDVHRYTLPLADLDVESIDMTPDILGDVGDVNSTKAVAMDRQGNVLVGVNDEDSYYGNDWYDVMELRYLHGNTVAGSWTYKGSNDVGNIRVNALVSVRPRRYVAFQTKQKTYYPDEISRLQTRDIFFNGSDIVSTTGGATLSEMNTNGGMEFDWDVKAASIHRWKGAVAVYPDTSGLVLGRTDTLGKPVQGTELIDPNATSYVSVYYDYDVCAGLGGGYGVAYMSNDDEFQVKWAGWFSGAPVNHVDMPYPADAVSIAMDGANRRYIAWGNKAGVFVTRQGASNNIPVQRVDGDGANPLTASVVSVGGANAAAWTEGDAPYAVLASRPASASVSVSGKRFRVVPAIGYPALCAAGTKVAMLYKTQDAGGDTNLMLTVRRPDDPASITGVEVTALGGLTGRAVCAASADRILVVWEDLQVPVSAGAQLYAQLFSYDGIKVGSRHLLAAGTDPAVIFNGTGGFTVAYTVNTSTVDYVNGRPIIRFMSNVYMQQLNSGGMPARPARVVNTVANGSSRPDVCSMDSTVLVVWQQNGTGGGIMGRSYRDTTAYGLPVQYEDVGGYPVCTGADSTTAVVAWYTFSDTGVHFVTVDAAGARLTAPDKLNDGAISTEYEPCLTLDAADGIVTASWIAVPRTGWTNRRLMGQRFSVGSAAGVPVRRYPQPMVGTTVNAGRTEGVIYYDMQGRQVLPGMAGTGQPQLMLRMDCATGTLTKMLRLR